MLPLCVVEPPGRRPQNPYFFGREKMIQDLHQHIKPNLGSSQQKTKVCVLHGLGGTGKTQIATQYTHLFESCYKYVFWVRAEEPAEAARGFSAIATQLSDETEGQNNQQGSIEIARTSLKSLTEPWLLVFDNVVSGEDVSRYIPEETAGSIIITTQSTSLKDFWPCQMLVEPFNDQDGADLLLRYLNPEKRLRENGVHDSVDDAKRVSASVGGLPLAIAVIAGVVSTSKSTLLSFLTDFSQMSHLLEGENKSGGSFAAGYEKPLRALFDRALQDLTPESRNLLDCLSFMNPDEIQESMVFANHEAPSLKFLCTTDPIQVRSLQENLSERHLIEKKPSSHSQEGGSLSIHRHVKDHLQAKLLDQPEQYNMAFLRALLMIRAVFPRQDAGSSPSNDRWPLYEKYYLHAISLHAAYKQSLEYSTQQEIVINCPIEFATLLSDVANYMYERYLIKDAFKILDTADAIFNKCLGTESIDPERIQALYLRASIELNYGITKRADGIAHKEHIVKLRTARLAQVCQEDNEEARGLAERQLSTAYNNLACAYMHCDEYERAVPFFQKALAIKKKWRTLGMGAQLPAFSEMNKNLALVALSRGNANDALNFANEAVSIIDQWEQGGARTKVGQFMRFMRACVLFNIGEIRESLVAHLKVLEARYDVLGETHDHTLDSYYTVGMVYTWLLDWENARFYLEKCLQFRHAYYETRLPRVLCCLGRVLSALGEHEEAKRCLDEARDIFRQLTPENAPGVDFTETDERVKYDQIVNLWSGRLTGKLNLKWQRIHPKPLAFEPDLKEMLN